MPQQHQLGRLAAQDLPAKLRADGAAAAGDQDALAAQQRSHGRGVGLHRVAAQQVLDPHIAQLVDADRAIQNLVHAGDDACPHARLVADAHDVADFHPRRGRHGDDHLARLVLLDHLRDGMAVAQHRHTVDAHVVLAQIVIQEAHWIQPQVRVALQLPHNHRAGVPRAHDQHGLRRVIVVSTVGGLAGSRARRYAHEEARPRGRGERQQQEDQGDGAGQRRMALRAWQELDRHQADRAGQHRGSRDRTDQQQHLLHRRVAPVAGVDAGPPEDQRRNHQDHPGEQEETGPMRAQLQLLQPQHEAEVRGQGQQEDITDEEITITELFHRKR